MKDLRNFVINIKPIMIKLNDRQTLSIEEQKSIVNFYLEIASFLAKEGE